jgi:hypothetical protein
MNSIKLIQQVSITLFNSKMLQSQIEGILHIMDAFYISGNTDPRWLAYMLATAYHETDKTMRPVEEYGRGAGHRYGKKIKQNGTPYETPDKIFYGRGYVQLTWYDNYDTMGKLLNIDLLNKPELALDPHIAANIMIEGMTKGLFSGVPLDRYFNATRNDAVNARKIINRLDCAERIAAEYQVFLTGLQLAA